MIAAANDGVIFVVFYAVFCDVSFSCCRGGHIGSGWCCCRIYKLVVSLLPLLSESTVMGLFNGIPQLEKG